MGEPLTLCPYVRLFVKKVKVFERLLTHLGAKGNFKAQSFTFKAHGTLIALFRTCLFNWIRGYINEVGERPTAVDFPYVICRGNDRGQFTAGFIAASTIKSKKVVITAVKSKLPHCRGKPN